MEKMRRKAWVLRVAGAVLWILCVAGCFAAFAFPEEAVIPAVSSGIIGTIILVISNNETSKLKKYIAKNLIYSILSESFGDLEYNNSKKIDKERIKATGLIENWNSMSGNDYFKGTYKNITVEFCDVQLVYEYPKLEDRSFAEEEIVFSGTWLICDYGNNLPEHLRADKEVRQSGISENDKITAKYYTNGNIVHFAIQNNYDYFEININKHEIKDVNVLCEKFRAEVHSITDTIDKVTKDDTFLRQK